MSVSEIARFGGWIFVILDLLILLLLIFDLPYAKSGAIVMLIANAIYGIIMGITG